MDDEASSRRRRNKENCDLKEQGDYVSSRLAGRGCHTKKIKLNMQMWRNWQTRWIQVPVRVISYGFESLHLHQKSKKASRCEVFFMYLFVFSLVSTGKIQGTKEMQLQYRYCLFPLKCLPLLRRFPYGRSANTTKQVYGKQKLG